MADWTGNPIMEWSTNGGTSWTKITDHGRGPIQVSTERIENKQRMANGTLRRYTVAKKRTITASWDNLPDKPTTFLANGQPGNWIEDFHEANDGSFLVRLRAGSDRDTTFTGVNGEIIEVMITDFSKEVNKRGTAFDLWNLDITLEEV
jgi:hypothetical protein